MTDKGTIYCGHCGCPVDACDCGVDYEVAYHPAGELFSGPDNVASAGLQRLAAVGAGVCVLLIAAVIYCL